MPPCLMKRVSSPPLPQLSPPPCEKREELRREEGKIEVGKEDSAPPMSTSPDAIATGKRKRLRENIGSALIGDEMEAEVLESVSPSTYPFLFLPTPSRVTRSEIEATPASRKASASIEQEDEKDVEWEERAPNKCNV